MADTIDTGATKETSNSHLPGANDADHQPRWKPKWRTTVEQFSSIWYTLPMNTGIPAILMWNLPYQFSGLHVLATIMYVFDIVLFVAITMTMLVKWTFFWDEAKQFTAGVMDEIALYGGAPIALLTIVALTALVPSNAHWGGHAFTLLAYVLWWIASAWMATTAMTIIAIHFQTYIADNRSMSPTLVLPCVGVATAAVVGAVICQYAYDISARLAVPVLIVAYMLDGFAIFISVIVYTLYFHHLMAVGFPKAAKTPSMVMLVGPFGQTAAALLLIGSAAESKMEFAHYGKGTFLTMAGGASASGAGILLALLLLGFDVFWICTVAYALARAAFKRELSYNLTWWSTIFPLGTTTIAFLALSAALDSPAYRGLTTGMLIFLLVDYFVNWGFSIYYSLMGQLLVKPQEHVVLADMKEE